MKKTCKDSSKMSRDVVIIFRVYVYRLYNREVTTLTSILRNP